MADEERGGVGGPLHGHGAENPGVSHEEKEVNFKIIFWFALSMVIAAVVIHVGLAWMYFLFLDQESREKRSNYPLAEEERRGAPPLPEGTVLEALEHDRAPDSSVIIRKEQHDVRVGGEKYVSSPDDLRGYRLLDREKKLWAVPVEQGFDRVLQDAEKGRLKTRKGKAYTWKNIGEPMSGKPVLGVETRGGKR